MKKFALGKRGEKRAPLLTKKDRKRAAAKGRASAKKIASFYRNVFTAKPRFILLIGDEGTILIYMKGSTVISREFVPDASEGNLELLRETIAKDRQAPITMVIDSVDQSFVQQTLPPVSSLSVQKLIKRRLDRDFRADDIKGAILLGKDKAGRKDWNFLMISVEKSPQLVIWLDFVMTFENRFRGIVLLSVEAGIVVRNLERAVLDVPKKTGSPSEWKILVSHNKVGGFRQIILRNGRLIFTRLALPVGEPTPEVIAGNIEQEMLSTIEYLKRFGYNAKNGLDVYIVASQSVCERIDAKRFDAKYFHTLSPHMAAMHLGLQNAAQEGDQFGDVVLASAVGSIQKNILKLTTVESRLYDKYQIIKFGQRLVGTFTILGLIVYGAILGYSSLILRSELEDAEQRQRINQQALEDVKRRIDESKINLELVGDRISLYQTLKEARRTPVPFFSMLSNAVKPPVFIKAIHWQLGDSFGNANLVPTLKTYNVTAEDLAETAAQTPPESVMEGGGIKEVATAEITVEFPAGLKSPALFKKFSEDFLEQLHQVFWGYAIAYSSVPPEYMDTRSLQMDFNQKPSVETLGKDPVSVRLIIRGEMPMLEERVDNP